MKNFAVSSRGRRRLRCTLAFLLLLPVPTADAAARPEVWSMKEAVQYALSHNPDSRIAANRITAAGARRRQAESAFSPRLDVSAAYGQTDNPMYSFGTILNQGSFANDIDFNDPGRTDNLNMKAELLYRFYNGGRDRAGIDLAESDLVASRMEERSTRHRLGFEVVRAFQAIVQAQDQVAARQSELEAIEASLEVSVARYEAGDLLRTDMLNLEVQQALASENLIAGRHALELARQIFLNLLGLDHGSARTDRDRDFYEAPPPPENYQERPEIAGMVARLDGAAAELNQAEAGRYPTLDGFANYQYDQGYVIDGSGDSWTAGLKLNYTLYDGSLTRAAVAEKKARYEESAEQLAKLKLAVNLEIQEAELNYRQAIERLDVTDKMVAVARESAQLSRERFKEGVILASDLIDVEVRLTDTLVRQSAARATHQIAIANLRRAAGLQQFADTTEDLLENQP